MPIKYLCFLLILTCTVNRVTAQDTLKQPINKEVDTELDYRKDGNGYLLVLKSGQPVIASLNAFMAKEKLPGASITAIGAVKAVTVAYYNIDEKRYVYQTFNPSMEVISLTGNLGYFENKPIVHSHIALAGPDYKLYGGHLKEATVSLILEIFITPTTKPITREWNKDFPEIRTMTPMKE
ncbi:PPC domain-containing DNA-binding protein [Parasediminibacterium paludis]|uniref:PPC domain-containing DNA-binding protein n=1 Tax=Parasediminibacterium paludis TaxID=908966 RepID=A0ABV8Q0B0_9BACT